MNEYMRDKLNSHDIISIIERCSVWYVLNIYLDSIMLQYKYTMRSDVFNVLLGWIYKWNELLDSSIKQIQTIITAFTYFFFYCDFSNKNFSGKWKSNCYFVHNNLQTCQNTLFHLQSQLAFNAIILYDKISREQLCF